MKKRALAVFISFCLTPAAYAGHTAKLDCTSSEDAKEAACLTPAALAKTARIMAARARMAKATPAKMDHSKMAGMDHSKMAGMDHSKMAGMDHSKMKGMDHSKMEVAKKSKKLDCTKGENAKVAACLTPAALAKTARVKAARARMAKSKPATMDHSNMKGMDHSKMGGMDHSNMKGMDHSKMAGMDHSNMKPKIPVSDGSMATNVPLPYPGALHMQDDPFISKLMIDALEINKNDEITLEADAWLGYDLHKLWLKTELEMSDGKAEEAELQALYSRGISPYWDFQIGVRKDFKPVGREWAVVGMKGTAPYYFDIDTSFAVGKGGQTNARFNAEYELMLTQKLVLAPELDLSFYGKDDAEVGVGSGLSSASVGLKLGYEFKREFTPYIGVRWSKKFGGTADFAREEGEDVSDTQLVLGIEAWF